MAFSQSSSVRDYTVSKLARNSFGAAFTVVLSLIFVGLLLSNPPSTIGQDVVKDVILFHLAVLPWIAVHESVHMLTGVLFGAYTVSDVRLSFNHTTWAPSINIGVPITLRVYRHILLAPLALSIPLAIGLIAVIPTLFTTFFAVFIIASCSTDLLVLHKIRSIPGKLYVVDHPVLPGVTLLDMYSPDADDAGDAASCSLATDHRPPVPGSRRTSCHE